MITLWGRDNSSNVKKVRWCLEELALEYRLIPAGGQYGITHDPDYLAMNPNGLVPCLQDSTYKLTLWESNTILRYLAAEYGKGTLWSELPATRAESEKWMDWGATTLASPHRVILMNKVRAPAHLCDEQAVLASMEECNTLFALLDDQFARESWLGGSQFSLGDIALAPMIYNLFNIGLHWPDYPHLNRWYQQLTQRPAFKKVVMLPVT